MQWKFVSNIPFHLHMSKYNSLLPLSLRNLQNKLNKLPKKFWLSNLLNFEETLSFITFIFSQRMTKSKQWKPKQYWKWKIFSLINIPTSKKPDYSEQGITGFCKPIWCCMFGVHAIWFSVMESIVCLVNNSQLNSK